MTSTALSAWDQIFASLERATEFGDLLGRSGASIRGLPVAAAAFVLERVSRTCSQPLLVVVPRESDGLAWVEAARLGHPEPDSVVYFPSPALTPFQETEISLMVRAQETLALERVRRCRRPTVVCTPRALFRPLPPRRRFEQLAMRLASGGEIELDELAARLTELGYRRTELVAETGSFAIRGGVVDLFPLGEEDPLRLDFFGDAIESIRAFDPVSQRSGQQRDVVAVLPLSLFPAGDESMEDLAAALDTAGPIPSRGEAADRLQDLRDLQPFPGWENYLPLLFEDAVSLDQWLPAARVVAYEPQLLVEEARQHARLLHDEHEIRAAAGRLVAPIERLTVPGTVVLRVLEEADVSIVPTAPEALDFRATSTESLVGQLPRFPRELELAQSRGDRLLVVSPAEHHERLREMLEHHASDGVELVDGELRAGFRLPGAGVVLYGEAQLVPTTAARTTRRTRLAPFLSGLRDLKVGEYVVHQDHGIGQFVGMRSLEGASSDEGLPPILQTDQSQPGAHEIEVMEITYASGRSLLLPLQRLDQIQKYSGLEGIAPKLDRLGGSSWNRKKGRVRRGLQKLAMDLLQLYAEREVADAPAIAADGDSQHQFELDFEFEETPDQLAATAAIKKDLESGKPMDRLLCGDVGFGKTEVAMRAAFKAVDNGHQVAVLAPTTILADQHLSTFRKRFAEFPVEIDMISRFRTAAEARKVREEAKAGRLDVLIGTHRLLSRDLQIPRLGLVIIDEEQRFGVAHKEKLKELRKGVHVLALSATPVPRTLQLSLAGVRDLSTIETPPRDRRSVETQIVPFSPDLIKEVIQFEIERGGQIYFVHNRVEDIEQISHMLRELVPGLRLTVGHGQLKERELAERMHAFQRHEYDLLLATTIIENGIDIPRVNTMIVHRADRFGLSQLYQLRGRVGRSRQLAYCYLLVPGDQVMTEISHKRLRSIQEFTELGSGFRVAARDLEIRGAGNLLGAEQSGHIAELGIETYLKMLEDAVRELRGEITAEAPSTSIDLPLAMAIPQSYIQDTNLRMEIYQRLATAEEPAEEILAELRERFGAPPESVRLLVDAADLKTRAERLRVQSISASGQRLRLHLRRDTRIQLERLIELVHQRDDASFSPDGVLTFDGIPSGEWISFARQTLELLSGTESNDDATVH